MDLDPSIAGDPAMFAQVVLNHTVWGKQRDILRAIANKSRVAVRACHSSSKTFLAAEAVLWWTATKPGAIAVTTAPVFSQVRLLLWNEIKKNAEVLKALIGKNSIELMQTEMRLANGSYAIGLSTDEGVRFQGFHGDILFVIDEAPGLRLDIWEAIEGARAGGQVCELAIGNPTIPSGPFYNAFTKDRDLWTTFSISAFDTPNLAGTSFEEIATLPRGLSEDAEFFRYKPLPYLVTRRWVYEVIVKYGADSPYVIARVLAQFPEQTEDSLIWLSWIEAAKIRYEKAREKVKPEDTLVAGIDVAGTGINKTIARVRSGPVVIDKVAIQGRDSRGEVALFLAKYKSRLTAVNIDVIGEGDYFARHFEDLGYPVNRVNVGVASYEPETYKNLKAEMYWTLRERFRDGDIAEDFDEDTIAQLASIKWRPNSRGQIEIESKEEMAERNLESPDEAESLMLCFARPKTGVENFIEWMRLQQEQQKKLAETGSRTNGVNNQPIESGETETGKFDSLGQPFDSRPKISRTNPAMDAYTSARQGWESTTCKQCGREVGQDYIGTGADKFHPICWQKQSGIG